MHGTDVSVYSELTAGQYEGQVLKRERNYKWRQYWCVLHGRQLTFYEDSEKHHVAGRIEIQPGSRCDKLGKGKRKLPSFAELFHKEYRKSKKYPLRLKTKKGTHLFTYEDVKEQSRWQMAMNNASQEYASGVRLSWIPTSFSTLSDPVESDVSPTDTPSQSLSQNGSSRSSDDSDALHMTMIPVTSVLPRSKPKSKRDDDTRTLITESDSEMSDGLAFSNPSIHHHDTAHEIVTSLWAGMRASCQGISTVMIYSVEFAPIGFCGNDMLRCQLREGCYGAKK